MNINSFNIETTLKDNRSNPPFPLFLGSVLKLQILTELIY